MTNFPQTDAFSGFNLPSRLEGECPNLQIKSGAIPRGLEGTFFRVQPDPQFPPLLGDDIAFNGDGMITQFCFHDGQVDFRQRWAHTDKWKLERKANRALFGAYRNPLTDDDSVKGEYRSTANTNAFVHGGRLYALKEDSPALEMNPDTLETIGFTKFGGMTGETFTAHPKTDPKTGNMAAFGYASKGILTKDMTYYEISPDCELLYEIWFEVPYYAMMHDFGITENYAIFHVVPSTSNWERLEKGLPHFGFDTTLPVYLGVVPRRKGTKPEDIRWFKAPNLFASHVMNAFEDGSKIHFDTPEAKNNMFPFFPDINGAPFNPKEAESFLTRWTVDLASESEDFESRTQLTNMIGEFPRIDDRYTGLNYRYGWLLVMDQEKPVEKIAGSVRGAVMNTLGMIDHKTGKEQKWWCGATSSLQEPCFIPRNEDADEGEGWIVQICNRLDTNSSDLLLFDATNIAAGPIAEIIIPVRMRFGLHGNWMDKS